MGAITYPYHNIMCTMGPWRTSTEYQFMSLADNFENSLAPKKPQVAILFVLRSTL